MSRRRESEDDILPLRWKKAESESSIWQPRCSFADDLQVSKAARVRHARMPIEIQLITRSSCGDE
jgi:hypothetical protein